MGLGAGGDSGGVIDIGSEDTMPIGITDRVIVYGNVLLHDSVETSKLQMCFFFFQLSISTAFAEQVDMPLFHCSVPHLHAPGQGLSSQIFQWGAKSTDLS